jgi:tetratricopeptide (TPR) repeat protein
MNWWEILGISYDSDLKTIKKAYAKLLKIYNPEEDPEGYQRLREAYDKAIKDAKNINKQQNLHINLVENISNDLYANESDSDEWDTDETIIKTQYKNINDNYEEQYTNNINDKTEEFLNKLNEIYSDNSLKESTEAWEELLNMDVVWNVHTAPIIEDHMFEFLASHKNLPLNIWYILDYNFNWTKKEESLYKKYDEYIVQEVFKILQNIRQFKYEYIKEMNPNYIGNYLSLRHQGYEALKIKDYYEARERLFSAYEIFTHDGELLKLIGEFYYKTGDLDKSLEFYKLAFEINKSDLDASLWIGTILWRQYHFSEALPYVEIYLSTNDNDIMTLNNIGYCYYFAGNLVKAKESFKRALELQPKNKRIKKCIMTIEAELEGKNVKPLKLKKRKPRKKRIIKKKNKRQKSESSMEKSRTRLIAIFMVLVVVFLALDFASNDPADDNTTEEAMEYRDEVYDEDETVFKNIRTRDDFHSVEYFINLRIYLDKVIPTNYFKLSEKFEGKTIVSQKEIEVNNLQDTIESQLFVGIFDDGATLFTDKNYKKDTINKNAKYKIEGAMCKIDTDILEDIKTKFEAHNENDKTWTIGIYIDCSPKEFERLRKYNESFEIRNGREVKVAKTLKELKEEAYTGLNSIYLKNIIPLNVYANVDENGKLDFRKKEELNGQSFNNKIYTQAFAGQIDGKNVMFIDSDFSMNNVDSNGGYNIEGHSYKFTMEEPIKAPTEKGQNVDSVEIDPNFLCDTKFKTSH